MGPPEDQTGPILDRDAFHPREQPAIESQSRTVSGLLACTQD